MEYGYREDDKDEAGKGCSNDLLGVFEFFGISLGVGIGGGANKDKNESKATSKAD